MFEKWAMLVLVGTTICYTFLTMHSAQSNNQLATNAKLLRDADEESPLSVEARTTALISVMTSYQKKIESIGKNILEDRNGTQAARVKIHTTDRKRLFAQDENFFDELEAFPFVQTVFFKWNITEMRKYLFPTQYPFTSTDCKLIGKFTNLTKCSTDISGLLRGHKLDDSYVRLGLPSGYSHDSVHQTTWTFLHVIQDAAVSEHGDVIAGNLTLTPQKCRYNETGRTPSNYSNLELHDQVFAVHQFWDQAFYHSHFESVPRLAPYVKFLNDNPSVKIFLRGGESNVRYLGIKNLDQRRLKDWKFRARVLYSPAGSPCGYPPLLTTQLMSLYAKRGLENNPEKQNKIILIKRSHKRFFRQHEEIAAMLEAQASEHDLELFVFRDDPVPNINLTRRMFNEAFMIIAPHGAGESNMLYAQPGTVILEGMCFESKVKVNTCYQLSADLLGMRYYGMLFKSGCFDITAKQMENPVKYFLQHLLKTTQTITKMRPVKERAFNRVTCANKTA